MLLALRLRNFVNRLLARSGSTLVTQALPVASEILWLPKQFHIPVQKQPSLPLLAALLVTLPVFVQAPLVRQQPMLAVLFTFVLLAVGISKRNSWGNLLVGFSGSWLAVCFGVGSGCIPSGIYRWRHLRYRLLLQGSGAPGVSPASST